MRQISSDQRGENVAGLPILRGHGERQARLFAGEEGFQIGNAAMVDIAVSGLEPPAFGISAERRLHICIDEGLKIEAESIAVGADDNIGAHAFCARHIAVREAKRRISRIISERDANLRAGGGDKLGPFGRDGGGRGHAPFPAGGHCGARLCRTALLAARANSQNGSAENEVTAGDNRMGHGLLISITYPFVTMNLVQGLSIPLNKVQSEEMDAKTARVGSQHAIRNR